MPTPEERLVVLLNEKQKVEARFKEANDVIDSCKQAHAEIIGGIKVLESLISEVSQGGEEENDTQENNEP